MLTPALLERREVKLLRSKEYTEFRARVALQRVATTDGKDWAFYQVGPKEQPPLVLLHGTCGTADWFFFQLLSLQARGYHVISVTCPPYWTHDEWVTGFNHFRLHLNLRRVLLDFSLESILSPDFLLLTLRYTYLVRTLEGFWLFIMSAATPRRWNPSCFAIHFVIPRGSPTTPLASPCFRICLTFI
jgi:hypothetical protein